MNRSIDPALPDAVALGEILWDLVGDTRRLGGAPLNFAAHLRRLGHAVSLVSGVGADAFGREAAARVAELDLDTRLLQTVSRHPTGTAEVRLGPDGSTGFSILRPAAYDAIELSDRDLSDLRRRAPRWFYFGTLFAATPPGRRVLERLLDALDDSLRFFDVNLRPDADSPALVAELLARADVVKLNEDELARVREFAGLPSDTEAFCRAASGRFGWKAVAVTRGERGSAALIGGQFVEKPGVAVVVADTVGAGDAFAAAFVHGLSREWPAREIVAFANRVAADVASRHGSLPDGV